MVSQAHTVGHVPIQYRHCFLCDCPFLRCVGLHNIALMNEKGDIEPLFIVTYPAGLFEKIAAQVAIPPLAGQLESRVALELGVRQNRNGERFRRLS